MTVHPPRAHAAAESGHLAADIAALAAISRGSASPGERRAAQWVAERLRETGASDVRIESFRGLTTYAWTHVPHLLAGLVAARRRNRFLALAALASFELEVSGRLPWLRRFAPRQDGASIVARIPAQGPRRATLVLVAHLDTARTGLGWHPAFVQAGTNRRLRRRAMDPSLGLAGLAFLLAAAPARRAGAALLALAVTLELEIATNRAVPGASDNASGVAALLALARLPPLPGVETVLVAPGAEESGMDGMRAFLESADLDSATALVLGLDTLGAGTPIVAAAEGALATHRYRDADLALADAGAARAGEPPPPRWRIAAWTDPVLALHRGLPAVSILSVGPRGHYTDYHLPTDTPERVDLRSVERCARLARGIAEAYAAAVAASD